MDIRDLLAKTAARNKERKRQEMKKKIETETAAAAEAIRAKYAKETPADWNESEADKVRKEFIKSLKK